MAGTDVQVTAIATKGMDIEGDPGRANNYAHLRVAGADVSGSNKVPVLAAATDTLLGTTNTNTGATATAVTANGVLIGATNETPAASDGATSGLNGLVKRLLARLTTLLILPAALGQGTMATSMKVVLPSDQSVIPVGGTVVNPTGVYTRQSNATPYTALDLVTNGTSTVQTLTVARVSAGSFSLSRLLLTTNHTTGLSGKRFKVRLWSAAPTYTNADNGVYAVATGGANFLGSFSGTFEQHADAAAAELSPDAFFPLSIKLASGTTILWDMQTIDDFTPQSAKTFTCLAMVDQD